jgi:hypothetical protein
MGKASSIEEPLFRVTFAKGSDEMMMPFPIYFRA